jgi:hypothetical protein
MALEALSYGFRQAERRDLTSREKLVLLALADSADAFGTLAEPVADTSRRAGMPPESVAAAIRSLERYGVLEDGGGYLRLPIVAPLEIGPRAPTRRDLLRREIFERDGFACLACGATEDLTVDHVLPRSAGGGNGRDNLQTLCRSCNSRKGSRLL